MITHLDTPSTTLDGTNRDNAGPHSATPDAAVHPAGVHTGIDSVAVERFVGQILTDYAGAASTAMTVIGDRLGLYRAMTGRGPVSAGELASRTGLHLRLVTEWLNSQAVSGYIRHDATADAFELPAEHAMALSIVESPAFIVGAADIIAGQYQSLPDLERAFRGDGGIPYQAFPHSVAGGIERFFATAYTHQVADVWFPAVDGLVDRLVAGARVADVGCGHGAATLLIGHRWPRSTVTGFDADERSIRIARTRHEQAGAPVNVDFQVADAVEGRPADRSRFDVVTYFDALHDLGDPAGALRRARDLLVPGGILVMVEPWSADRPEDGIGNPVARINWAISTSLCTPTALAQGHGQHVLGNQGGPTSRLRLLTDAGFTRGRLAVDTGQNLVLTAVAGG